VSTPLTVQGAVSLDGTRVGLRSVDGTIAALGADVVARPGDDVLDARGDVLLPALVNGHTHAAMTLFRGYGGDLPLMEWLEQKIWPAEARLTDDDVYWGTRLACVEMIRTGTARFWDMYWRPAAVARAVRDAGMRATIGPPLLDGLDASRSKAACDEAGRLLDELVEHAPWVQPSLAPHGIYTASEATLRWVAEQSDARGVPVHLHFLETEDEVTGCVQRTGERPGVYLQRIGLLSPRLVLAHGVWMEDPELELVAASGATVVTNPVSNLKLAVGRAFPYAAARRHGIPVALGTDGASSNNSLDLVADVKVLALLQKFSANDPAALPASEAWQIATGALAPTLGSRPHLAVGDAADFLLARTSAPELAPGHVLDNLVYAASGAVVRTTVVAGRVLMRDGVVIGADGLQEDEIHAHAVECARRLGVL
jgi:5-methylthioadenosine/S-adenosylhomocysteine deaminase